MIRAAPRHRYAVRLGREVALVAVAYGAYYLARVLATGRVEDAFDNAQIIVSTEQALGIFVELPLQIGLLGYDLIMHFFSLWYFWGHFPLIALFGAWTLFRHTDDYRWARNAIFIAGALALIGYTVFPVAPPRLLPAAGFVDTLESAFVLKYSDSALVNQFAAVPSMHFGFAVIIGATLYRILGGRRGTVAGLLIASLMLASIIVTGNHYFLDAVLGLPPAIAGMMLATRIERYRYIPRLRAWLQRSLFREERRALRA